MEKESTLYHLMGIRMNGIINRVTSSDGEYLEIIRNSDEYSDRLDSLNLPRRSTAAD